MQLYGNRPLELISLMLKHVDNAAMQRFKVDLHIIRGAQSGQGVLLFSCLEIVQYRLHKFCALGSSTPVPGRAYEWRLAF